MVVKSWQGPVRKDPSLLVRGDRGFWVVCFMEIHVLAQCGVQGSVRKAERWLPHAGDLLPHGPHPPFLITSPKGGMR
jgi:hypothetical protein